MSGPLRKVLGPVKKRLDGYIIETRTHMTNKPNMAVREEVTTWLRLLRNDLIRIQDAVKSIDDQNNKWSEVLEKLEGDKLAAETELYDNAAGGELGFINAMEFGREATYALISTINEAERTVSLPNLTQSITNTNMGTTPVVPTGGGGNLILPGMNSLQISVPKTKMREFSGDKKDWPSFWSLFSKTIDNQMVPDVQKFNFLLLCLKGDALALVEDYDIIDANYSLAIEDLKERYGDTAQIKSTLHADLRNLKPATSGIQSIRSLVDSIEKKCKQLEKLGEDLNNSSIVGIIEAKLPRWIRVELIKSKKVYCTPDKDGVIKPWNTSAIRQQLKDIVSTYVEANNTDQQNEVKERSQTFQKQGGRFNRKEEKKEVQSEVHSEARVFAVKTSNQPTHQPNQASNNRTQKPQGSQRQTRTSKYPKKCLFCDSEDHYSSYCTKFSSGVARQKRLNLLKRCVLCFFEGHNVSDCPKKEAWKCNICHKQHRTIVCPQSAISPEVKKSETKTPKPIVTAMMVNNPLERAVDETDEAFLMTREVIAFKKEEGKGKKSTDAITSNLLIDPGATRSLVEDLLSDELDLDSQGEETLNAYAYGSRPPETFRSKKVKMAIGYKGKAYQFQFNTAPEIITEKFPMTEFAEEDIPVLREKFDELPIKVRDRKVNISIGMDYCWDIIKAVEKLPSGLILVETLLGPVICGPNSPFAKELEEFEYEEGKLWNEIESLEPISSDEDEEMEDEQEQRISVDMTDFDKHAEETTESHHTIRQFSIVLRSTEEEKKEDKQKDKDPALLTRKEVEKFWSLEDIAIKDDPAQDDNEVALAMHEKSTYFNGIRYSTGWPWRSSNPDLPTNLNICIRRLQSTWKKLNSSPELRKKYDEVMRQQEALGIIEEVPDGHTDAILVHYLPHHFELPKFRIVFGANARMKGRLSLNDCMFTGPNLLPDLVGLLLRFRTGQIVITADVEKAFLMVELHLPDREVTRFYGSVIRTNHLHQTI